MKVKIQSCTKELRQTQKGESYTGVKINGQWYNVPGDVRNLYNKEVDVEIKGKWARILQPAASNGAGPNGGVCISWWEYIDAMRTAHEAARELEPDDGQARAALVDTAMIALTNGRVKLPPKAESESDAPPPDDDDIPF